MSGWNSHLLQEVYADVHLVPIHYLTADTLIDSLLTYYYSDFYVERKICTYVRIVIRTSICIVICTHVNIVQTFTVLNDKFNYIQGQPITYLALAAAI